MGGHRAEALAIVEVLRRGSGSGYISPFDIATVYVGLNMRDAAFSALRGPMRVGRMDSSSSWWIRASTRSVQTRAIPTLSAASVFRPLRPTAPSREIKQERTPT